MSEKVTIWRATWRWLGLSEREASGRKRELSVEKLEAIRTEKQIRIRKSRGYEIVDPGRAHYTLEHALASVQSGIDFKRREAEKELAEADDWQQQLDDYRRDR